MARGFTDIAIHNLKPGPKRQEIPDPGTRGLYAIIEPSGFKSFAVRYRFDGKPKKLSLGAVSLATARVMAAEALKEAKEGRDPTAAKREAKQARQDKAATTFRNIALQYFRLEAGMKGEGDQITFTGKMRTAARRFADTERLLFPALGNRPIRDIKRSQIVELLDNIQINNGPVMADRMLATIRTIMNWYVPRSDDFSSPIAKGMARTKAKERARDRTLSDDEIRKVWNVAKDTAGPFPALVRFLLLTAARRSEASDMKWDEIKSNDWTLPASRNKTKVDLTRPLSAAAIAVIEAQRDKGGGEFVFGKNGKPLTAFSAPKTEFDAASGTSGWTIHDLRRTARSLLSRAKINADHAEQCLGHIIPGVRGTYDRHHYYSEKQHAYAALASLIDRIVNPPEGDKVVPLTCMSSEHFGHWV
jgi:integrase